MSVKLSDEFGDRANPPSAAYPAGSLKDETNPGVSNDGTPLSSRVGNDFQGFMQSALAEAGIDANGNPESVENPQILNAIKSITDDRFNYDGLIYQGVGNISDFAGQQLQEDDKTNAYQYPDNSRQFYAPDKSQTFPITIPADPTVAGSNWFLLSPSGVYRGLWPDTGGSANKGDTYQTQVGGVGTGQYFTALQGTTVDPIGDNVNWMKDVSVEEFDGVSNDVSDLSARPRNTSTLMINEKRNLTPWGELSPVNMLGDSITFGYFASLSNKSGEPSVSNGGGMFYNSYPSLLARMIANEFGNSAYKGFSPNIYEYAGDLDIAYEVSRSGFSQIDNAGDFAANLYSGQCITSTTAGNEAIYKVPATFDRVIVWYVGQPGGGTIEISVNGSVELTESTSAATVENRRVQFDTSTVGYTSQGNIEISIKNAGGLVSFSGIGATNYRGFNDPSQQRGGSLNQFAAPGRTLRTVSEKTISDVTSGASALIMALGYNDKDINYSGKESERVIFSQRIDWLIQYCNSNNCPLIVPDFTWNFGPDAFTRTELRRACRETGGTYIPLPDLIRQDGQIPSNSYLTDNLKRWYDPAHPNRFGHEWIANTIAKYIGLSCSTKKDAIRFHDYWVALDLNSDNRNIISGQNWTVASYKLDGDLVHIRTQIALTAGGFYPDGNSFITEGNTFHREGLKPPYDPTPFTISKIHEMDNNNSIQSTARLDGSYNFYLTRTLGVEKTSMNGSVSFELRRWDL
ncbi:hypothetical protein VPH209E381_0063 [Vibrio phage 209E38-1]